MPGPNFTSDPRYVTAPQAAELLGIHRVTLWRWMEAGKIKPLLRHGGNGQIIFRCSHIDNVAAKRAQNLSA